MATGVERSVPEVLQDIVGNVQEIIRSEVRLAAAELKQQAGAAARAGVALPVGVVFGLPAPGFLLLALVYGLAVIFASWWIAALILGGGPEVGLLGIGRGRLRTVRPATERTIRSVKESLEWGKSRTS